MLFIQFGQSMIIPGVDFYTIIPTSIFFLIGFLDIFMVKRVWLRGSNGWEYGIAMSVVIPLLTPVSILILSAHPSAFLYIVIDIIAIAEILALVTPGARRFYGT
ncbi:MAG: hypothetical protein ACW979_07770 [Candidatus Thorarchaeota archaeon]